MPRATREDRQYSVSGAKTLQLSSETRNSDHPRRVMSGEQEGRKQQGATMDNIPNVALNTAVNTPEMLLDMYNMHASQREPSPSDGSDRDLCSCPRATSHRMNRHPIAHCACRFIRKTLERFIFNRIEAAIGHLLADNQYRFSKGRSTLDAINQVVGKGKESISGKRWKGGSKKYCLLVTLNVRNAFNSARWKNICLALDKLDVPAYLKNMIKSYLANRLLVYDTEDGPKEYQITGGVPKNSVLGSPLWNIMYDDLLKIQEPRWWPLWTMRG